MRKLLASLLLLLPGHALAEPPESVSSRMAFDEVADALQKRQKETNNDKHVLRLRKLAPTVDPRVALALGELLGCGEDVTCLAAATLGYY